VEGYYHHLVTLSISFCNSCNLTLLTKKRGVPARELERAVIHKLRECGNGSKELRDVIEKANQKAKGDTVSLAEERERVEKTLNLQNKNIQTFLNSLVDGSTTSGVVEEKLKELEGEKRGLDLTKKGKKEYLITIARPHILLFIKLEAHSL